MNITQSHMKSSMKTSNTPATSSFYKSHTDLLAASAISLAVAQMCGLRSIAAPATAHPIKEGEDCIEIPFHTLDGTRVPTTRYARQDCSRSEEKAGAPGLEVGGRAIHPFLPFCLPELMKTRGFLIVTVGEFAALAGCSVGLPSAAVHAPDGWIDPDFIGMKPTSETRVHSALLDAAKRAGRVLVLGASNCASSKTSNREDATSLKTLVQALQRQADGVVAAYMSCPAPAHLKAYRRGPNVTLGDWIAHLSSPTASPEKEIAALVTWHLKNAEKQAANKAVGGYIPLGMMGSSYVAWSNRRNWIDVIPKKDMKDWSTLAALATYEWCSATYPTISARGEDGRPDFARMTGDLMTACEDPSLPPFDVNKVRKGGVYVSEDNPEVLVVNGSELFRGDGKPVDRVGRRQIYMRHHDIGINQETELSTTQESQTICDALDTWNWSRPSDARLFLGATAAAYLSGALSWRTHLFVHGEPGSGKTRIMKFTAALLGGAGRYTVGSSPASVRQALDGNAIASICDEQGSDSGHLSELMKFFKNASSGGWMEKGDGKQNGVKRYQLSTTGFVAGVHLPLMDAQQEGRFLLMSLKKVKKASKDSPHPLVGVGASDEIDFPEARILGEKLFARMVYAWPRFKRTLATIKPLLDSGRMQDTVALPLAGAWIALHDEELTDAQGWIDAFDLEQDIQRIRDASDNDEFLTHLMSSKLSVGKEGHLSVSEVCLRAYKDGSSGPYYVALKMAGMRIHRADAAGNVVLLISSKEVGFKALFRDSKVWSDSNLAECIHRIPGASQKLSEGKQRFSGKPERYLTIPFDTSEG
jgi:hypothetical protein